MNLSIETTLHGIAHMLRERIAPAVEDKFAGETARLAEMLLSLSAGWVDDAAAVRVAENARVRALFAEAGSLLADADLAECIAEAAGTNDPGLKISELDRESNRLRRLLTGLHAHLDANDGEKFRAFSRRIWRALAEFEAARAPC
jgi:hypothetical protein